jgi:hypothetical protein
VAAVDERATWGGGSALSSDSEIGYGEKYLLGFDLVRIVRLIEMIKEMRAKFSSASVQSLLYQSSVSPMLLLFLHFAGCFPPRLKVCHHESAAVGRKAPVRLVD